MLSHVIAPRILRCEVAAQTAVRDRRRSPAPEIAECVGDKQRVVVLDGDPGIIIAVCIDAEATIAESVGVIRYPNLPPYPSACALR
jgi:hypothetical protein